MHHVYLVEHTMDVHTPTDNFFGSKGMRDIRSVIIKKLVEK